MEGNEPEEGDGSESDEDWPVLSELDLDVCVSEFVPEANRSRLIRGTHERPDTRPKAAESRLGVLALAVRRNACARCGRGNRDRQAVAPGWQIHEGPSAGSSAT